MNNQDVTLNARIHELENKLADTINRLSKNEGMTEQLNKSIASGNRLTNWQFVVFMVALLGSMLGSMYWATGVLEKRFDERFSHMEQRFEERSAQMEKRFEERSSQLEKRFEDLRQVVLAQQKR